MRSLSLLVRSLLATTLIGALLAGVARAEYIGPNLVWVTMSDAEGRSATAAVPNPWANDPSQAPPRFDDMLSDPVQLAVDDTVLGEVHSLGVALDGDPMASINFSLTAGASDVTVTVSSATVSFPTLNNPPASAAAEVTLTDNGGEDAMISTLTGNDGLFQAIYNTTSEYAELLGDSSVGGGSVSFSEDTSDPIAGSASSIRAQFAFRLTADDSAMGSGKFTVVPEPTSAVMLLAAGLGLAGARRRNL